MAGIMGIVGDIEKGEEIGKEIGKMQNQLKHRGPHNRTSRIFRNGAAAVGCVELNLSNRATFTFAGNQEPLVLLDGDIYNTRKPKKVSNVNLLRKLYLKHGKKCFSHLDGCFACAIIDEDEIILARDPVGVRSLVYGNRNGELYFASEAKALRDKVSQISILPPGHFYSTRDGLRPFKAFAPSLPADFDPEDLEKTIKIVRETMIEAVQKCLADGAVGGVALSGGLDSSIVTAILAELDVRLPQFTSTVKRAPGPDLYFSGVMAKHFGLEQIHYLREITDEEIVDILPKAVWFLESFDQDCISGWIANYFTALKASELTNCVFVGETADEISGGYLGEFEDEDGTCWVERSQMKEMLQKLIDIAGDTGLKRLNQGWHACSVVPRTPFPDPKLVAVFEQIPLKWKYNEDCDRANGEVPEKWILRKAFEYILPPEITWRKKMRFSRGVGVDGLMDELVENKVSEQEFQKKRLTPVTGLILGSRKELYYYNLFYQQFPMAYENLTVRWDPFIK